MKSRRLRSSSDGGKVKIIFHPGCKAEGKEPVGTTILEGMFERTGTILHRIESNDERLLLRQLTYEFCTP